MCSISLKGQSLAMSSSAKLSGGEEKLMTTIPDGVIPAHGHFLISNNTGEDSSLAVIPDLNPPMTAHARTNGVLRSIRSGGMKKLQSVAPRPRLALIYHRLVRRPNYAE